MFVPLCLATAIALAWNPFLILFHRETKFALRAPVVTTLASSLALTGMTLAFLNFGVAVGTIIVVAGLLGSIALRRMLRHEISVTIAAVCLLTCFQYRMGCRHRSPKC